MAINIDVELIDTKALLADLDIEYSDRGKNVTRGWVNIACPFCGDHSNHCGINLTSNLMHCWICKQKGSIINVVAAAKGWPYKRAAKTALKYAKGSHLHSQEDENSAAFRFSQPEGLILVYPEPLLSLPADIHIRYLESRGFDPAFLTRKYKLKFTYNTGSLRFKIIAPIFVNGEAVSWIAADIIRDDNRAPYIKCPLDKCVISANSCLYNIDAVAGDTVVLVEGITDVWRCGDGFVASMTKDITAEQIGMLMDRRIKNVFVMYDADAEKQMYEAALKLKPLFSVEAVLLSEGDPADLSEAQVANIRKEIFS